MADDPLMRLPASALRHAARLQAADQTAQDRFNHLARLAETPGAVDTLAQMWVTCERCRRPVERMGWTGPGPRQEFTVWCHGEAETMTVDLGADVVAVTGGVAFRRRVDS